MAEQRVIVVTEVAPKLKEFSSAAAREFLREYVAYENRLDATEAQMPLRRCIEPEDLETLLQCSEDMSIEVVRAAPVPVVPLAAPREPRARAARMDIQTPLRNLPPQEFEEEEEEEEEKEDNGEDVPDQVVWMSNAHIEAMIIHVLGPESVVESTRILQEIKMSFKDTAFSRLGTATNYVRQWKDALRWCQNFMPRDKPMKKIFIRNMYPRKFAMAMDDLGMRSIEKMMITFVSEYQKCVKAKKVLTGMDHEPAEAKKEAGFKLAASSKPPGGGHVVGGGKISDRGVEKKDQKADWKLTAKCFKCNQTGHISPDCPNKETSGRGKKLGALVLVPSKPKGPYLAVDAGAPAGKEGGRVMRLLCNMDSGAECNAVPSKWVDHLEQHGGVVKALDEPVIVEWLDKKSSEVATQTIELCISIAECKDNFVATFLVVPWDMDHLVVGWDTITCKGLLKKLEDYLVIQKQMNVAIAGSYEEVNMVVENMDGKRVTSDSLRFFDDLPDRTLDDSNTEEEPIMDKEQKIEMDALVEEFQDVFNELPAGSAIVEPMRIVPKLDWKRPPMEPFRRYSPKVEAAITMDLKKQLDAGVIEESNATNGCHVHAVPKSDSESGYRFCVDYRPVNDGVETAPYPLPAISVILLSLSVAMFYARLDLKSGYWQFPVAEECKDWLAFHALGRMYTYCVVPMGFVQSSFHVQRAMYSLFAEYFGRGIFVYLDDIIVYAPTWSEYIFLCRAVFEILRKARLVCKRAKCAFGLPSVQILGHIVSRDGLKMSEGRKEAVMAVPFPRNTRELRRFLGMCNYMRMFIRQYSLLAKPLSSQVNIPATEWPRKTMATAFEALKTAVAEQLSLAHLDYTVPIVLQTDASTLGVGAALINRYPEGDRVVACCSHAFTETERRWKTIEQEAFAVVFAALYWLAVLLGHHFVIETDHRNLVYIHSGTSAKVTRWSLLLQSLCYSVSHLAGALNVVADTLSRTPARVGHALHALRLADFDPPAQSMRLGAVRVANEEMAYKLFLQHHNDTVGHLGLHAVLRALQGLGHTWVRMSRDCARWIAECAVCQKYRLAGKPVVAVPSPIASFQIFEEIGIDYIGPMPKDQLDNSYICNLVCMTTHYCELFAVEAATAVIAAHCLLNVVARYGCFRAVRSDRGSHFVNEVVEEFCRLFEIQQVLTLPERPQANAIVERNGGEATRHLRAMVAVRDLREGWSMMLPLTQRIINNTWKESIGTTPHRLIHWAPTDLDRGLFSPFQSAAVIPPLTTDYVRQVQKAYERLLDETSVYVVQQQEKAHEGVLPTTFEVGGYVLMSYLVRPPSKLAARWAGPYRIARIQGNNVELEDLTGGSTKTVDVSRLKHFLVAPGVDVQAVAAADMGEASVQAVVAHRGSPRKRASMEFQVQWTDGDVTWEPWERVRRLVAVDEYIRAYPQGGLKALLQK